ncbi:SCO4402 family protein [Streptomyces angustmyceticus]|uniref:SCO4402 family protein n=1 Tax=Streptomyces angustmyceticus TaxID=285578 RepID=UPI0021AF985D|nr:hypothetical protein [Streptomyces angustmyceticus]
MSHEFVNLPEMRKEIISAVKALSDTDYQQRVWIDQIYPNADFFDDFTLNVNVLYDDTTVLDDPAAALGQTLANDAEVAAMQRLAGRLGDILDSVGRDADDLTFLQSPLWSGVVTAAQEALRVLT